MIARWAAQLHGAFVRLTLIEILGWLVLLGVLAKTLTCGLDENAWPRPCHACRATARIAAQDLQSIADGWRYEHDNACPQFSRLKEDLKFSESVSPNDPWGSPFIIYCDGNDTTVVSAGPDHKLGTADDIAFPPKE